MRILKRNGKYETLSFDKILKRISSLANDTELGVIPGVECDLISQKVIQQLRDGISSKELDVLAADISTSLSADNPDYGELASRIAVSNLHKSTPKTFSKAVEILFKAGVVNKKFADIVSKNSEVFNNFVVNNNDYLFDFFGISTLEKGYLLKTIENGVKTTVDTSPRRDWQNWRVRPVRCVPDDNGTHNWRAPSTMPL